MRNGWKFSVLLLLLNFNQACSGSPRLMTVRFNNRWKLQQHLMTGPRSYNRRSIPTQSWDPNSRVWATSLYLRQLQHPTAGLPSRWGKPDSLKNGVDSLSDCGKKKRVVKSDATEFTIASLSNGNPGG